MSAILFAKEHGSNFKTSLRRKFHYKLYHLDNQFKSRSFQMIKSLYHTLLVVIQSILTKKEIARGV